MNKRQNGTHPVLLGTARIDRAAARRSKTYFSRIHRDAHAPKWALPDSTFAAVEWDEKACVRDHHGRGGGRLAGCPQEP